MKANITSWEIVFLQSLPITIHRSITLDESMQSLTHHRDSNNVFFCSDILQVVHNGGSHGSQELCLLEAEFKPRSVIHYIYTADIDSFLVSQSYPAVESQVWLSLNTLKMFHFLVKAEIRDKVYWSHFRSRVLIRDKAQGLFAEGGIASCPRTADR